LAEVPIVFVDPFDLARTMLRGTSAPAMRFHPMDRKLMKPNAPNAVLSSGDDDATRAYLFRASNDPAIYAVTRQPIGDNLPALDGQAEWVLDREFALGVREAMPIHLAPEPVLRALRADGYFLWSQGSNPVGTSQ
jgi:hypothetical protein